MGALTPIELREALAADADVVVWSERHLEEVRGGRRRARARQARLRHGAARHARRGGRPTRVARAARSAPGVELAGVMTHFATADDLGDEGFFADPAGAVRAAGRGPLKDEQPGLLVHAANSAAMLRSAESHFDMVRCGIAVYGMDPFGARPGARGLEPALELSSYVAEVKPARRRRERRLRPALRGRARHLHRRAADRLRRRLAARAVQQRRRADRRAPPPAGGHREHGQHHRRPRARAPSAEQLRGRAGDPDRRPGQRADHRRGGRPAPGHDQLRDHLRAHAAGAARLPPRRRRARGGSGGGRARGWARQRDERRAGASRAHGARRQARLAGRRGWCATALLGREHGADLDVGRRRRPGARPRARSRAPARRRRLLRALGGVRRLARGGARATPGRWTSSRCAASRSRPTWRCATSPSTRSPSRSRAASRSTRSAASRTCARAAPAHGRPRGASRTIPCACCAWCASRVELGLRARRGRDARGRRAAAAGSRGVSAERVFVELRRIVAAPAAAAGLEMMGELRRHAPSCCPSSRRCAASSRAASTTSTSTATRSRCSQQTRRADAAGGAGRRAAGHAVGAARAGRARRCCSEPLADGLTRGEALRWGALLHDAAKPLTRAVARRTGA